MEQSQEIIKQWLSGPENIYNFNLLTYPSHEQQAYIINQHQLFELCKQYSNQQDFQKNLVPFTDQHKAIIYVMFLAPQYQRILFDLMNIKGFHNIIAFYQEFGIFLNTQYHLLKEQIKPQVYSIMKLFLENPLDQLEECFKSFLRIGNIYLLNANLQQFLIFLFDNFRQILSRPNLAALLFYKYLLILNIDDYYKTDQQRKIEFPIKIINDQLNEIWNLHNQYLLSFGRELLINLQVPISYSEINLTIIKQNLPVADLISNKWTNVNAYKVNYQLALPFEIEQRISFAVFQQTSIESVQTSLQLLFEKYGYSINFIGAIIRNIICGYSFDEKEIVQQKIAEALLIIYEIAELTGEKWPIFLRYIYSDIFFMTKDFKDDHNIQPGLYFLRLLHIKLMYNELNGVLWFIFQTFETNDQLKKKVQPQLLAFSQHIIFQKLLEDANIREANKSRIHEYFLKYLCSSFPGPEGVSYQQQQSVLYNVEELDTPFVFDSSEQDNNVLEVESSEESKLEEESVQMNIEDQDTNIIEMDQSVYKILEKEKIDSIFMNPQSEETLIKFLTFFNKAIQIDVKQLFLIEITKIMLKLYEDQFYDVNFEYQFNCLITLLKIDFNNESFLSDLFESLIQKEQFGINIVILAYFENKVRSQYLENFLFKSHYKIFYSVQIIQQLITPLRSQRIVEEIISNQRLQQDYPHILQLLSSTKITIISKIKDKILTLLTLNSYQFIIYVLQRIGTVENQQFVNFISECIINLIESKENQKDMDGILESVIPTLETQNKTFWTIFCQVYQNLIQWKRVNEDNLLVFFIICFQNSQKFCEGISEIFLITPNTLKSLIFKALYKYLDHTKNFESIELIIKYLAKDAKNNFFKNPLQTNLENYIKQIEKK